MKQKWSRRGFLRTTVEGSLIVGGAALIPAWPWSAATAPHSGFSGPERETLRLAIDELIPHETGRPAASEVGGLSYLERRAADDGGFGSELQRVLAELEASGRAKFGRPFARLVAGERDDLLRDLERTGADLFSAFRDAVYEAYYTQPEVWHRIGYEFHAGVEARSTVPRFDESALASARKLPKRYREVR